MAAAEPWGEAELTAFYRHYHDAKDDWQQVIGAPGRASRHPAVAAGYRRGGRRAAACCRALAEGRRPAAGMHAAGATRHGVARL